MLEQDTKKGRELYSWAEDLFPICRSLTGSGVRETLRYIKNIIPALSIISVPTGLEAFDWKVPKEWVIRQAYIEDALGNVIVDFKNNNLHVVGYSEPIDEWMNLDRLDKYLHSLPEQPNAIPYVTSYYNLTWGFCLSENQRRLLESCEYHVVIDSELKDGCMNYGELIIHGESAKEVLLSTYICHPSMGNNEISGPVVTLALARWLAERGKNRYTYRIIFIPETIGSIVYLSKHYQDLKQSVVAGLVLTCIGDDNNYSFLPSRIGDTLIDRVVLDVMNHFLVDYTKYSFLDRGSDERQYCSPGIDLPVASIMRTKYGVYPEYHTSLDDLSFISPEGLAGGYSIVEKVIQALELNKTYVTKILCEPQLGKRNLYPQISTKNTAEYIEADIILNLMAYCDGKNDLLNISQIIKVNIFDLKKVVEILLKNGLIEEI